jgi:hypothetical protein
MAAVGQCPKGRTHRWTKAYRLSSGEREAYCYRCERFRAELYPPDYRQKHYARRAARLAAQADR